MKRRYFLGSAIGGVIAAIAAVARNPRRRAQDLTLRPPGARPGDEFLDRCARCFRCGEVCPNGCIEFHGFSAGLEQAFTPYIKARTRACILCGDCTRACPTGALLPFESTREGWMADVSMGKAYVNRGLCYSFAGRTCGACYRACPLAGQAITIGVFETPTVHRESCVGCGLCEQACLHLPQAIRVIPKENLETEEA